MDREDLDVVVDRMVQGTRNGARWTRPDPMDLLHQIQSAWLSMPCTSIPTVMGS